MHKDSAWHFEPNDDPFRPTLQEGHSSLATVADRVLIAGMAQSRGLPRECCTNGTHFGSGFGS